MDTYGEKSIRSQTLGDLLRRTARRFPDKQAILCGDTTWTYAEFDTLCSRIANSLHDQGVDASDRVAILSRNSHAFAAVRFAIARMGAVLVPINFMLNAQEIAYILKHSGAKYLMVDEEHAEAGKQAAAAQTMVEKLFGLPSELSASTPEGMMAFSELLSGSDEPIDAELDGEMLAQIIYTSGTESSPKGAMLTHRAVISEYVTCLVDAEIAENDVLVHALPLYHCAQLDVFLGPGIYVGTTNIITANPAPENLLELLARFRANSFFAPPTVWISLLRSELFDETDLSALKKGYYGASIMPVEVLKEIVRRIPDLRLWNLYGQTEIAPVATVLKPEDQLRKAGSAGRPALNVETRVVDDAGADVAVGEIGEIVHRSPQLIEAYLNDPEKTGSAFEGGWFHSGDLAIVDEEGYITVVDRKKDMIKTGGENVSSREVEEALYLMDQVSEVAVIGLSDPKWIEAVTAVVVVKDGHSLDADTVLSFCDGKLAKFKVPKRVEFIEALPKNPSGKVLKRDLRIRYEA